MDFLINFGMFFGALFAAILALGILVQKQKAGSTYLFAMSFFGLSLWLFQISLYSSGVLDGYHGTHWLKILPLPLIFMVPPLMVFRYVLIISSRLRFRPYHLTILLPAAASLALLAAPLVVDGLRHEAAYLTARPIMGASFAAMPPYNQAVYLLYTLPKVFLVLCMIPVLVMLASVWRHDQEQGSHRVSRIGYLFALSIVLSNVCSVIGDFIAIDLVRASMLMANTAMTFVYLMTQRHPDYTRLLRIETRKARYKRSILKGLDLDAIITRLHEIMEDEKAFADEDLTLNDLARDLDIGPHQLSQILNNRIRKNFNTFVNEYRVEEAKRLLREEPDRSILSIGAAAGFNSTTTFNTVFARHTGLSPRQYRKTIMAPAGSQGAVK